MTPSRRFLYPACRLIVMSYRSVHEMIWTIVLVAIVGFGMLPGTLFCIGFGGKLMSEAIEAIRKGPVEAIRATGAGHLQTFVYAVLPQVRVAWAGNYERHRPEQTTLYRLVQQHAATLRINRPVCRLPVDAHRYGATFGASVHMRPPASGPRVHGSVGR